MFDLTVNMIPVSIITADIAIITGRSIPIKFKGFINLDFISSIKSSVSLTYCNKKIA